MVDQLTSDQLDTLDQHGFLVIERNIPYAMLQAARDAADRVTKKCIEIQYPYYRCDNRLSDTFIEKIENIFSPELFEPALLKPLVESAGLTYVKQVFHNEDFYLAFQRLHVTRKYSAWSSWHRDAFPDGKFCSLKLTIPLFHEVGFYVIPGSHKKGDKQIDDGSCESEVRDHQQNEVCVPVRAGDILLFHSSILHRGTCPGREKYRRAHLHFNFIKMVERESYGQVKQDFLTQDYLLSHVSNAWKEIFSKQVPQHYDITVNRGKSPVAHRVTQTIAKIYYYFSSLLPHTMTQSPPFWLVPYRKCEKKYKSYFEGI